jgi:hypothetical protein
MVILNNGVTAHGVHYTSGERCCFNARHMVITRYKAVAKHMQDTISISLNPVGYDGNAMRWLDQSDWTARDNSRSRGIRGLQRQITDGYITGVNRDGWISMRSQHGAWFRC